MAGNDTDHTISIGIEYHREGDVGVAKFLHYAQPITATYAITPDRAVAFLFDKHWAGRLDRIIMNQSLVVDKAVLVPYMGTTLAEYLTNSRQLGVLVTTLRLTVAERLALAKLQADSPATPAVLRKVCRAQAVQLARGFEPVVDYI